MVEAEAEEEAAAAEQEWPGVEATAVVKQEDFALR